MDLLSTRLASSRVPYDAVRLAYAQHGFDYNFDGWGSQVAQPVVAAFLRAQLSEPSLTHR
ncbi:MAG: hypothetical protein LC785_00800 [Acidobacteria bacterium]|nr:hypothetical protein [Acidobacteriota bacterium]